MERAYTSRRMGIIDALVEELKKIDGVFPYQTNLFENVHPKLEFWDEMEDFPTVCLNAGSETRAYQGAGIKDRFMAVTVRCYVREENAALALEGLLEDIETLIEENSRLKFLDRSGSTQYTQQITILSIDTDEGVLEPLGVGEILCEVRY